MSELLPKKEELFKITEDWTTFSGTPFQDDFDLLPVMDRLQIINDIIRQTILFSIKPNPIDEKETLTGDSFTASIVAIDYLKSLNLGENHRLAFVRKHHFEAGDNKTNDIAVLLDIDGDTYYFNCSPYVGFGYGKVDKLANQNYYEEVIELSKEEIELINRLRLLNYKYVQGIITSEEIKELKGLLASLGKNPNTKYYSVFAYEKEYDIDALNKQLALWQEELGDLITIDSDYPRQLELAQAITSILVDMNIKNKKYAFIDGVLVPLGELSPRFFYERDLTAVYLKPSAYLLGLEEEIKRVIVDGKKVTGTYPLSLGDKSEDFGLERMKLFHPHGYKYLRSMTGPGEMFLVHNAPAEVHKIKKSIRENYANDVKNTEVLWFDGKPIFWDPIITNLVHSTDDACEASLHYVSGYPEYSLMTRFMYPNPVLRREKKK